MKPKPLHCTFLTLLFSLITVVDVGAQAQALPCQADVAKLCAQSARGAGRVSQCIKQNMQELSSPCRTHVQNVDAALKETRQPCQDELLLLCNEADLTEPRIATCLNRNRAALSDNCKRLSDLLQKR